MIRQRSHIDCEKHLPSFEYEVTIGRTVLGTDSLVVRGEEFHGRGRGPWKCCEMLMISNGYFLARRDIVRESSSICSKLLSAMRRLYLRVCEKMMLSLPLSEWLE